MQDKRKNRRQKEEGRKGGREEGRKGRKREGRKGGRKEGRKKERKEGRKDEITNLISSSPPQKVPSFIDIEIY